MDEQRNADESDLRAWARWAYAKHTEDWRARRGPSMSPDELRATRWPFYDLGRTLMSAASSMHRMRDRIAQTDERERDEIAARAVLARLREIDRMDAATSPEPPGRPWTAMDI